jgi:imidazolonepropionase-like amidohydrolase
MIARACLVAVLLLAAPSPPARAQASGSAWAITGGVLIDGTGAPPLPASVIVGRGDRITCVGTAGDCGIPAGAATVSAAGKWVIPGLIDTHVHLNWGRERDARKDQLVRFAFGATATRDAGTPDQLEENLAARSRAESAEQPEPRVIVSGLVSAERGQGTAPAVAAIVQRLASLGVDAIKIKQEFSADALLAIGREADAAKLPVFGHTWGGKGSFLTAALDAGFDGVSHMYTFSELGNRADPARPPAPDGLAYWVWTKELWNYQDESRLRDASDRVLAHGAWIEPMFVTEKHFTFDYPLPRDVAYLGEVLSIEQLVRRALPVGDTGWPARRRRHERIDAVYAKMCEFVRRFHANGGMVVTGTDDIQPGLGLLDEVALLTECGFTPMEALRAATERAAAAVNRPDLGTLQAGMRGDLVILDGDPLDRPANLRRVFRVVKGGHVHDPAALLREVIADYDSRQRAAWSVRVAGGSTILAITGLLTIVQRRRRKRRRSA